MENWEITTEMKCLANILSFFLLVSVRPICMLLVCKDSHGKLCQSQCCSKRQAAIITKSRFKRLSRILFKPQKHRRGMDKHSSGAEEPGDLVACLNMPSWLQNLEDMLTVGAKETTRKPKTASKYILALQWGFWY